MLIYIKKAELMRILSKNSAFFLKFENYENHPESGI